MGALWHVWFRRQILGITFSIVNSSWAIQMGRLMGPALLPTKPSCRPWNILLKSFLRIILEMLLVFFQSYRLDQLLTISILMERNKGSKNVP